MNFGRYKFRSTAKMIIWNIFVVLFWISYTSGQSVTFEGAVMIVNEMGTMQCQINNGSKSVNTITWWKHISDSHSVEVYTYWPPPFDTKKPGDDLVNRSDYQHSENGVSTLIIENVRKSDQGYYSVNVEFSPGVGDSEVKEVFVIRRLTTSEIKVDQSPVVETDRVEFLCVIKEDPVLEYRFKRADNRTVPGIINQENGTLTISLADREDEGNYSCLGSNQAGLSQWSEDVTLEVDYPPEDVMIDIDTDDSLIYTDDNITVVCNASGGRPLATSVEWNCLGHGGGNGTLTIDGRVNSFSAEVNRSWNGQPCSCLIKQRALSEALVTQIVYNVSWPPEGPSLLFTPDLPWLEDNNGSASCQPVDFGNPPCSLSWFIDSEQLQVQSSSSNITLFVTKEDNKRDLKCLLENQHTERRPQSEVQLTEKLDVYFSPRVSLTPPELNLTLKEKEILNLNCSAESNPEADDSDYKWTFSSGGAVSDGIIGSKMWQVGEVGKEEAGTYTCEVSINISHPEAQTLTGRKNIHLIVHYLHVNASTTLRELTQTESLTLACTAEGIPDDVIFLEWKHTFNGTVTFLPSTNTTKTTAFLVIPNVQSYNAGNYTCRANNSAYEEKTAQQRAIVRYKAQQPEHPANGRTVSTGLGKTVSLPISVDAYPPFVNFTWYFVQGENTTLIVADEHIHILSSSLESTLTITNTTWSHFGRYMVHTDNGVLNGNSFIFILEQKEGPGAPFIDASKTLRTPISVVIQWQGSYDGGYPQTFSVLYTENETVFKIFETRIVDQGSDTVYHMKLTPLTPGTSYQIKVMSHNEHMGGSNATSNVITVTTLERPRVNNSTMTAKRYGTTAYLRWDKPEGNFDTQRIDRYEREGSRNRRALRVCTLPTCHAYGNLTSDETTFNATSLEADKLYKFELVLFFMGDLVNREEFTEEVLIGSTLAPPDSGAFMIYAIAGGAGGGALVIIIAIVIAVIVTRRMSNRKKASLENERNMVLGELMTTGDYPANGGCENAAAETEDMMNNGTITQVTEGNDKEPTADQRVTSNPPPGSEGMMYATVEFMNQEDNVNKEEMPVKDSCEYADIDHTRKTGGSADKVVTGSASSGATDVMATSVDESLPEYASVDYSKKKTKHSVKEKNQGADDEVNQITVGNGKEDSKDVLSEEKPLTFEGGSEYAVVDYSKKKRSSMKPSDKNLSSDDATHAESEDGNGKSDQSIII